ncbi:hypothetical protein AgCh_011371 [Apium graveolens]
MSSVLKKFSSFAATKDCEITEQEAKAKHKISSASGENEVEMEDDEDVVAKNETKKGKRFLQGLMEYSFTEIMPSWSENRPPNSSFLVPSDFIDSDGGYILSVRILGEVVNKLYTSLVTRLEDDSEPKDIGIPSELEQPYSRPKRSRKAPTWLQGFER